MRPISDNEGKTNFTQAKIGQGHRGSGKGKLSIVGIGPGDKSLFSQSAKSAISKSDVVIGYKTYIKLLGDMTRGKEVFASGMTQEIKRARLAILKANQGRRVSLISSGDPGVYGMAGLVLELLNREGQANISIGIVPGIIAATACASLLGAPLMHDFALISLSDLLTAKELIKKRVELAAKGDFVIVFYNPRSKKRIAPLKDAWEILLKYKSCETPVGIVRNAYRDGQAVTITELGKINLHKIDMFTTIIVGNSRTYISGKYIITPRGYQWA